MAVASLTDEDIKLINALAREENIGERVSRHCTFALCMHFNVIIFPDLC